MVQIRCQARKVWFSGIQCREIGGLNVMTQTSLLVDNVSLAIPEYVPATPGQRVTLPISLDSQGKDESSLILSIDIDQSWISFDSDDEIRDGLPDVTYVDDVVVEVSK